MRLSEFVAGSKAAFGVISGSLAAFGIRIIGGFQNSLKDHRRLSELIAGS
jgi:hypothetical protein